MLGIDVLGYEQKKELYLNTGPAAGMILVTGPTGLENSVALYWVKYSQ